MTCPFKVGHLFFLKGVASTEYAIAVYPLLLVIATLWSCMTEELPKRMGVPTLKGAHSRHIKG